LKWSAAKVMKPTAARFADFPEEITSLRGQLAEAAGKYPDILHRDTSPL
jgi:hypothetical protein